MTTKQKAAIKFCEDVLGVKFDGDVNKFLTRYLQEAKDQFEFEKEIALENSDILDKDYYE